ncbi:integrase core domain-containing protein [Nonomuraea sp. NPDC049152]|uniref:integrase core domain-containing protein n=1 Tax=Nonomuraea sp. NPDC049152 TaxID=3154350 RepID=UPI0033F695DB
MATATAAASPWRTAAAISIADLPAHTMPSILTAPERRHQGHRPAGSATVPQTRRMNAICERVIGTLRCELLDRILILSERHLALVLRECLNHYNGHRPRDRDGKFPALMDEILSDAGIQTPSTRPARRSPPRVLACRLNCMDGVFGRRRDDK